MRLAVLGAGAIGPATAALAVSRGHAAVLWSPSGAGTRGLDGILHAEGVLEGTFPVTVAATLEQAFAGADAALLTVPAYAFPVVLPRIAAAIPKDLPLLIAPAASLAPLAVARLRGPGAPVGAMATTPLTGRRLAPDRVRVAAIRAEAEMGALPGPAAPQMAALAEALFGNRWPTVPDALAAAFINANPIAHAALALGNVTRIEKQESWGQYGLMTPAVCRLMEALGAERDALAARFGHSPPSVAENLHRTNGVPHGPLHEMTAAIERGRGSVAGPTSMETRYVTEDVPYGLAFYLAVAAAIGQPMPVTEGTVTVLETLWGRGLRENPLLDGLDLARLPDLLSRG
ncbi:NAD/NADP octopine/nopaline dehydrogenase family protein [Roseomonas sp. HJA6]|uniref:NAD/NADP octopine/nopaline dehydrogenase family protein n=1 Tax=Roseomonas alba TaxID=2846776 RepID=A0ABS7A4D4_9PROT|nr:NAD/NADP-dependent octopine/nopaline dehydrogenase family protein [Neoroseomonas alba]MBW6397156.1 NAD/NADP octopine/nopaline dehydrogenase family protein [Neoroseomonas alba]